MSTKQHITLLAFLLSPREGMSRLNGWQRIWLVLTGILLGLHVVVGLVLLPDFSKMRFDQAPYERRLADTDKWQRENKQRCTAVAEDVRSAERLNAQYNAIGNAKATELRTATQAKLDEAKARLFAIETSGGKYYAEWAKHDSAIEAYTNKLREQAWAPRPFKADDMVKAESLAGVWECADIEQRRIAALADMDTAKQDAERSRENATNSVLATVISFFCTSLGLYFIGWCLGWIGKGFKAGG